MRDSDCAGDPDQIDCELAVDAGRVFSWNGRGGGLTSTCSFTINHNSEVTATFDSGGAFRSVQIGLLGAGKGEVGADNNRCQNFELGGFSPCTTFYGAGSVVTLEGRSMPGNIFVDFSGGTFDAAGCGSATPCVFTLNDNSSVNATFAPLTSVAVQPSAATINIGQTQGFTAVGTFGNGATRMLFGGSGSWTTKRSMSTPRFALGVGVVNNLLYAVGGGSGVAPTNLVEMYNPAVDSWTAKAPLLIPREGVAVAAVNGMIYALGGHTSGGAAVATVEGYDPGTNLWTNRAPMPAGPRAEFAAAVINRGRWRQCRPRAASPGWAYSTVGSSFWAARLLAVPPQLWRRTRHSVRRKPRGGVAIPRSPRSVQMAWHPA